MQILVISDTHGRFDIMKQVIDQHNTVDMIVHCGDGMYECDRWLTEFPEWEGKFIRVRGNCDFGKEVPLHQQIELPFGHKAVVLHGHTAMHGDLQQNLLYLAESAGADIVLFGHLHTRVDRFAEGIHIFNPGSVTQPRGGSPASFGLLDVLESGLLFSHGNTNHEPSPFDNGWFE